MNNEPIGIGARTEHGYAKAGIRVFFKNVDVNDGRGEQPTLILGRRTLLGRGRSYFIPLSIAHEYVDDQLLAQHVVAIADHLFDGNTTRTERMHCADAVLSNLEQLVRLRPEDPEDIIARMAEKELVLKVDGTTILDTR